MCSHPLEKVEKTEITLDGIAMEALDLDLTTAQRGGRREISGRGHIGFHHELARVIGLPAGYRDHIAFHLAARPPYLHQPQRHLDEWARGVTEHLKLEPPRPQRRGHQNRRYELRRCACIDGRLAAREGIAAAFNNNRWAAVVTLGIYACTKLLQRVQQRSHRALTHPLVAIHPIAALAKCQEPDDKAHRGTGAAHEEFGAGRGYGAAKAIDRDSMRGLIDLNAEAEGAQRRGHGGGVIAQQGRLDG